MKHIKYVVAGVALLAGMATAAQAGTLDDVKARGKLLCGVTTGLAGFGAPNDKGEWAGLDIDLCKGVAAAVFGDASKVEYKPLSAEQRFTALQSGEVDMLARNSTMTLKRDTELKLDFVTVNYYDGQGFMVHKDTGVKSALELKGATVCVQEGTTTEKNMGDFDKANGLGFQPVKFKENDQARAAYDEGRCDAYTTDASGLAGERTALKDPANNIILPEIISKEPLGPVVRHGDNQWGDVVRWTHYATLVAEEKGITQANLAEVVAANGADNTSADPETQRMLGITGNLGEGMGLTITWAHDVIKAVGNYGEIFERNIGPKTPIGLERGLNALWNKGGLQYAAPFN